MRSIRRATSALLALAPGALAGGSPENAVLLVDPTSPVSLQVGNRYRRARDLPDRNVIHVAPNAGSYAAFQATLRPAFLGALEQLGISDHADYAVVSAGSGFFVSASGLVSDACSPVNRFAVTAPYALARAYATLPPGIGAQTGNGYHSGSDAAIAFDAQTAWSGGSPSANGGRYFLTALLGYEGPNGNTVAEILDLVDRSAAVDGAFPAGTIFFCQTNDIARSGPRHGFYPGASAAIQALGLPAQHVFANLPPNGSTCAGVMTGLADPAIDATPIALAPGSFCDHLTSYAATFDTPSQTKCSRWIAKGASGTSGTVEEPCNYAGKFPHARLHVYYAQGLSLGESWLRSLGYLPFQQLFLGDPLCRPFAHLPVVAPSSWPSGPVSGTFAIAPSATTTHPTAQIARFELLVDGISHGELAPGGAFALDTRALADGFHDVRILAWDDTSVRSTGRVVLPLWTSNHGRNAIVNLAPLAGDLTTRFDFAVNGTGGTVTEARLVHGGRVVAARSGNGTLSVYGRTLGADRPRVHVEVEYADGLLARSAPFEIDVADAAGAPSGLAPVAHSHTKRARNDAALIVELPATFDDPLSSATWTLVGPPPAQATVLGGTGPWRVLQPDAGAAGPTTIGFQVTTPSGTSTAVVTVLWSAPAACPAPVNYCAATPNSTGLPAAMSWSGSVRVAENALRIGAYDLPPSTFGVFFYGDAATQQPFGNGWRCVASPVVRLGVQTVSVFGDVERAIDCTVPPFVSGPGALVVGGTKRFQFWYRNPAAGGAGFNLTDGLAVTFCP